MTSVADGALDPATAGDLADRLVAAVIAGMSSFAESAAPSFVLPGIYAGHAVRDDTRSELLYVLGMLIEAGVDSIAGVNLDSRTRDLLGEVEPSEVEGFYSYRVAETVLRLGGLGALSPDLRRRAVEAAKSPRLMSALADRDPDMSPNYTVVAARCLHALVSLEERDGAPLLAEMVDRTRKMFSATPSGWVNDGRHGHVQFDIYTPDMYLLAEPFADALGDVWRSGFAKVVGDLDDLAQPAGAVVWGRSIGALAQAMTIELAGAASGWGLDDRPGRWLARVPAALADLNGWFSCGVINAHQGRSSDPYRGASRRLQMTLDVYGKLMLSALALRRCPDVRMGREHDAVWPTDRLIKFDRDGTAAAWAYRSRHLSFVLPLMYGYSAEYLPSPRSPHLLEQPVSGHPVMIPTVTRHGTSLVPAGLPTEVVHEPGGLIVRHDSWAPVGESREHPEAIAGSRTATYSVSGRTLDVHERLSFSELDDGPLSMSIGQRKDRPLAVDTDVANPPTAIDTTGIAEWRSHWGELSSVHQIELPRARVVEFAWSVTPRLRVATTDPNHPYSSSLYGPLDNQLVVVPAGAPDGTLAERLRDVDVLHVAWPERWSGVDPALTLRVIEQVRTAGTAIVWTQHNLTPHRHKEGAALATYALWAQSADVVIHHSEYGQRVALATYRYGRRTKHVIIPHGHWGAQYDQFRHLTRDEIERAEGWRPSNIRLAVIGQPRAEKNLQLVVDAVASCSRTDIQLVARLSSDICVSPDDRIIAEYGHLTWERYHKRMMAIDAVIFPFAATGMLTTGTAFDCIGAGVAAITSEWGFLDEVFAGAAIRYGSSLEALVTCLEGLTEVQLRASRDAVVALRPRYEWETIADRTLGVLEQAAVADLGPVTRAESRRAGPVGSVQHSS